MMQINRINNTLQSLAPKFHFGQRVTFCIRRGDEFLQLNGIVVGMTYISSAHCLLGRKGTRKTDLGWRYYVSTVEGLPLEALIEAEGKQWLYEQPQSNLAALDAQQQRETWTMLPKLSH